MPSFEPVGLTGVWDGQFSYPRRFAPVPFTAVILETGAAISGTIHETPTDGRLAGQTLNSSIDGEHEGSEVRFIKLYDPVHQTHGKPILYDGVLSADGTEIEGRWTVLGGWSGKFLIIRSGRPPAKAEARRRASVPAL